MSFQVLQAWLDILIKKRVFRPISVQGCSLTSLLAARAQFRTHPPAGFPVRVFRHFSYRMVVVVKSGRLTTSSILGSSQGHDRRSLRKCHRFTSRIFTAFEYGNEVFVQLLTRYGLTSFRYNACSYALYFPSSGKIAADKSTAIRRELNKNLELREIYEILRDRFSSEEAEREERKRFPNANESFFDRSHAAVAYSTQQVTDAAATSHPKLVKLVEILIQHFNTHGKR